MIAPTTNHDAFHTFKYSVRHSVDKHDTITLALNNILLTYLICTKKYFSLQIESLQDIDKAFFMSIAFVS